MKFEVHEVEYKDHWTRRWTNYFWFVIMGIMVLCFPSFVLYFYYPNTALVILIVLMALFMLSCAVGSYVENRYHKFKEQAKRDRVANFGRILRDG